MKKSGISILVIMLLLFLISCIPNNSSSDGQVLVVGSMQIEGNFIDGFDSSTSASIHYDNTDERIRNLIHGYETYSLDSYGKILLNETVVKEVSTISNHTTGERTYTFELNSDLFWSDGTKITANDYVFSILMQASSDWKEVGASTIIGDKLVGYDAYRSGVSSENVSFEGVKLISEYMFSLTLASEYTPLFYETIYLSIKPLPFHRLTPQDTQINLDTNGASISTGGFSLLAQDTAISGYRYFPDVTCGPYLLVSNINQEVTLIRNDKFKGNFEGKKPTIDRIIVKEIDHTLDVDLVIQSEFDLVTGVIEGSKIETAMNSTSVSTSYHSRNGYAMISIASHFGPTDDYKVRQAIANLINKNSFVDYILDGYGSIISSDYSEYQWMYKESSEWVEDHINKYELSSTGANAILDTTEWLYEDDGVTPFDSEKAVLNSKYYRHNAAGETLSIQHFKTYSSVSENELLDEITNNFQYAGINYETTEGSFDTLLNHYYYAYDLDDEEKIYHMFNLAKNVDVEYDPYNSWHSDFLGTYYNPNQLEDSIENPNAPLEVGEKTLDEITVLMREVEPGDYDTYLALWKEYQLRWNKLTPNIPLYSNQYYNVFDVNLKGVKTTPFWDWTYLIYDMFFI